jgi:prepilin-type N-terminal cleavage/methylation domain-containing protein
MNEKGFTLPELIIVMVVTAMFTTLIMFFTFNYWRYGYLIEADLSTFVTRLNAADYLREAVGSSSGFIIQNSIADPNTSNPDPAIATNDYWIPNHAVPGNIPTGTAGTTTPVLYFKRYSTNTSGALILNGTQPYEDEYVLYLNGSTKELLVRTLANGAATGNKAITSCPPALATASCPADKVIASDLGSLDIRYFSRSGNTVDWTSIFDSSINSYAGPDQTAVEVLELTLNISKKATQQTTNSTTSSTVIRIALRNA